MLWQLSADARYFMAMRKKKKKLFSGVILNMKNVAAFCNEVRVIHFKDIFRRECFFTFVRTLNFKLRLEQDIYTSWKCIQI